MTNWGDVFEASRERGKSSDELVADFTGTDEGKSGAFCQPPLLAAFVAMLAGTGSEAMTAAAAFETATAIGQAGKGAEGGLAKQICRTWLKYTFLGLGKECTVGDDLDACPRKHGLPANLNLLYKDYSFKGLAPQQRKKIIAKAKEDGCEAGEQQSEAAVEVSEGGDKRKREEREEEEEGVDAEEKTEKKKRKEAKRDQKEKSEKSVKKKKKKKSKKKSKKDKHKRESE